MVNFTFVSHKGARPEKSELVKSHVMRESQKKRREAKERYRDGSSLCEQSPARTSAARTEMLRQYQAMHQPLQPHIVPPSRAIPASQFSPIRDSAGGSAELLLLRRTSQPIEQESNQRLEARLRRDLRSSNTTDSSKRQNNGERLHSPHSPWTDSPFVSPQVQPLPVLADSSWMPETWLNRVNEVVSHYFVSFQGSAPDARSTLTYWFEQPRKSSIILLSYSLFYCAHRDLVHGIVGNDDHYFKARNLQLINAALEDPSTALADETIMTVVAMAMYENLRGSDQVITHERGLQQMFDMRGGIETFMSEDGLYIGNFALLVDIMHSCCSNKPPFFLEVTRPVLRDVPPGVRKTYFAHSPLRVVNNPESHSVISIPELRSSLDVLRDAFDAFEILCVEILNPKAALNGASPFRSRQRNIWARLQRKGGSETDPIPHTIEGKVQEAIRLAATIHFGAVAFRIMHDDPQNTVAVGRLHDVLKLFPLDFWKTAPYLYTWILLTGGAASRQSSVRRAYFVSEMMRVGYTVGFNDWPSFTQVTNNFLWLQKILCEGNKQ